MKTKIGLANLLLGWLLSALLLGGCGSDSAPTPTKTTEIKSENAVVPKHTIAPRNADLVIVSGSENKQLQPLITEWGRQHGKQIAVVYQGSVDIYRSLQQGEAMPYDAVWPANHLWIELGDTQKVVKHAQSIMRSPVILGLKQSLAQQLGWDKQAVKLDDIFAVAEQKKFRLAMTSATQSNSGASAYLGFLYAMADYPDTLTLDDLDKPSVQTKVQRLLATVDRSSGSSGWLKEAFVEHPERFDAMFNYEALLIEANQALIAQGKEPLQAIYPQDGLAVADSPLGFVDKGDADKEALFLELQQYLLSKDVQAKIEATGRRTGLLGMSVSDPDQAIWNPDWGIQADVNIAPIPTPRQAVIQEALTIYQTDLRKPSLTIWVLDTSGSMQGEGIKQLRRAMTTLLDPTAAKKHLLQTGARDITLVIPFNHNVLHIWQATGNNPQAMQELLAKINALPAQDGTDLYAGLIAALMEIKPYYESGELDNYLPAIVAMTDGLSEEYNQQKFEQALIDLPYASSIPIHAIAFGDADKAQMQALTAATAGRFFESKQDLPKTLRKAKGYN